MSTMQTERTAVPRHDHRYIWERQARPLMAALATPDGGPARGVVMGNAGSGKSSMLRELYRMLEHRSTHAALLGEATDVSRVPRSHVLLVDDLHLLSPAQADRVQERAEDSGASLVVASRSWPRFDALTTITRSLERSRPAIVLGHVSRSDILTFLEAGDPAISSACVDHLLEITDGVSWLVSEALALHDERDCADDRMHRGLVRVLEDRIAHRLETIPSLLRHEIELLCVERGVHAHPLTESDDMIAQGYAEGLLARNGVPVPLVRSAVRATIPVGRLIDLSASMADGIATSAVDGDPSYRDWIVGIRDRDIAAALVDHGDRVLERDPRRALELYDGAVESGADELAVAGRRGQAAWAAGEVDLAGAIVDDVALHGHLTDSDRIADTSAAVWSMRAMMRMSDAVYRAVPPLGPESRARATIAAFGAGQAPAPAEHLPAPGLPSTLGVALALLDSGLRATLSPDGAETAVADLVRASEMYTSSGTSAPIPELPAVIAAVVALNVGDVDTAHAVIEEAISGGQGGQAARARLLLWRSWIAVQRSRPVDGRNALSRAEECSTALSARDRLLAHAVSVAIARRYEDAAALAVAWNGARDTLLHTEIDLFLFHPLTELLTSAARMDDAGRLQAQFARALEIARSLGEPVIWSAHLHWAGIQQGILCNRPDDLKPHARTLVAASPSSPVAAVMAQAGRVWTATLAGSVDPDAVEAAAHGLASAGLAWDGARLAGHAASRTTDRKVSARLLSCARELHPSDGTRRPVRTDENQQQAAAPASGRVILSERELDVARLVLQGKTYAEIGATIFISPRTAEHHIAHMRRRLGAASRSDLISKLRVVVEQSTSRAVHSEPEEGPGERTP